MPARSFASRHPSVACRGTFCHCAMTSALLRFPRMALGLHVRRNLILSTSLNFEHWLALMGGLLLALSFASSYVQRLPISSSTLYLLLGIVVGPRLLGWIELRVVPGSPWFERLTEIAVSVALFISGLKLR